MLRSILTAAVRTTAIVRHHSRAICNQPLTTSLRLVSSNLPASNNVAFFQNKGLTSLVANEFLTPAKSLITQNRTLTKFSLNKGKRKSVKAVIKRFKRLDWGCWIRTHSGRHKKLFKKSPALRRRLKQHVMVNASQSFLLDKMVGSFWRKPRHYIDDPYQPYMKRDEYWATRTKPNGF
ncbi:39S ribosomal protein L35, mitochondrial [Episyrphus balteatus]|uniref:39S ribosomal protein L35, mitochondrial n=1 Tax=Episyrphus balteatus TaxID=286459 RepID=UPI0024865E5C|nr:39S ribosomal protein L35, mitochondrial [Episyrphus balteatus]